MKVMNCLRKNITTYRYLLTDEKVGKLEDIVKSVNQTIECENMDNKIRIVIHICEGSTPSGVEVLSLCNYSDAELFTADYKTLKRCDVWGCTRSTTIYNQPETYKNLQDIIDLRISGYVAQNAVEHGIDRYEYFPELERLEVILPEE